MRVPRRLGLLAGFGLSAALAAIALSACGGPQGATDSDGGLPPEPDLATAAGSDAAMGDASVVPCDARTYFEQTAWPKVFSICAGCHVSGGASGGTRFVLKAATAPNALVDNFAIVSTGARTLQQNGTPLFLLKPTGQLPHGGGVVVQPNSTDEGVLKSMVQQLLDPKEQASCNGAMRSPFDGLALMDAQRTLRKVAIELVGRLPTQAELDAAAAGDPMTLSGIDAPLMAMMSEPAFDDRLREMWNDALLTDKSRFESTFEFLPQYSAPPSLLAITYCDQYNWQNYDERTKTPQSAVCIGATEALAREPLEYAVHVVRNNRPFSEILTAQYRLFNVYSATLFGLDMTPFTGHSNDPNYFVEMRFPAMHGPGGVPEEYAGLITTNSFLYRYYSTSSNRNRGRAYQYYKLFLDYDVMKSGTRIDLSSIDLSKSPWRYDPQCTGCHANIDPVAGAFQHWTDCYDNRQVEYFSTRYCGRPGTWWPEIDMFAPGVGPGDANALSAADLPTALAHLTSSTVKDPAFARAVVAHVLANLTGHERLSPPRDPADPHYAALVSAYDAQAKTIDSLSQAFIASNFDFKKLVIGIVKTAAFRAVDADQADRVELVGLGGGAMLTPEVLHRKIASAVGAPWTQAGGANNTSLMRDPPAWLLSLQKFRIFAGGMDSLDVRKRSRTPGALPASVDARMALEMACEYTAYDFALDATQRRLFPKVERAAIPSGSPVAADQKPILDNLIYLHSRLLGETVSATDPELVATYQLLVELQKNGAMAVQAGKEPQALQGSCAAKVNFSTGQQLPVAQQFSADPNYVVRAWQGVIAYMLMDYRFIYAD